MREEAMTHYHGVDGYNCCQAILKTYQEGSTVSDADILESKKNGGGRAPENLCGALYALHLLVPSEAEKHTAEFEKRVGSTKCREIRGEKLLPCRECVGVASDIFTDNNSK